MLAITGISYAQQIDRKAVVTRHNPLVTAVDSLSSLSVGNGHLAVTVDITGLQSFPSSYMNGVPLCAMSDWGWHSFPNKNGYKKEETYKMLDTGNGHAAGLYAVEFKNKDGKEARKKEATEYYRTNPHRLNLGETGLEFYNAKGQRLGISNISHPTQSLNLWNGRIYSLYNVSGEGVAVQTAVHPATDCEIFKVESNLLKKGMIDVAFRFPYPSGNHSDDGADWTKAALHKTDIIESGVDYAVVRRMIDSTVYYVRLEWKGGALLKCGGQHLFRLVPTADNEGKLEVTERYICGTPNPYHQPSDLTSENVKYEKGMNEVAEYWEKFWKEGGIADFSGCTDARAKELERRVVLSQYLTAINCANRMPPQESGLTYNTWFGRPHLEMTWWHTVDFSLWNHPEYLENILAWYDNAFGDAKGIAERQGYKGMRWMKMTDPWAGESPSGVGSLLIWQQPHYIYLAEEIYRHKPAKDILNRYADKVFATAEFMADYVTYNPNTHRYELRGCTAMQECKDWKTTYNEPFELQYWCYGLLTAQKWRERLGLPRNAEWDRIINNMSPLPEQDGIYTAGLPVRQSDSLFIDSNHRDHPAVLGAYGLLPDHCHINKEKMAKTYDWAQNNWTWLTTWGWDYGMIAMTAARLGEPDKAVDALMLDTQKNTYLVNGHNYQDNRLRIYLPGNGALLTAVGMMLAGWDGCPNIKNPGFPQNGKWKVRWEGIHKMQ